MGIENFGKGSLEQPSREVGRQFSDSERPQSSIELPERDGMEKNIRFPDSERPADNYIEMPDSKFFDAYESKSGGLQEPYRSYMENGKYESVEDMCNDLKLDTPDIKLPQDERTVLNEGDIISHKKDAREADIPRHIPTINEGLEGKTYPGTDVKYEKHTFLYNGEKVEGVFPVFHSKFELFIPKELRNASDTEQFKYCVQQLAERVEKDPEFAKQFTPRQLEQIKNGEPRISGLTWHHNEIPGKMQLVDANEHSICRHTGGRSIWGGGSECR